jgi:DNA-binding IclR family transcriptional regulator
MLFLSHNIWVPKATVGLSPLSGLRSRGQLQSPTVSAVRALHVLEAIAMAPGPLRAIDVVHSLKLSPSSAHALLNTLVDSAYLIFDPATKRYSASPRLAKLGERFSEKFFEPGSIDRLLRSVAAVVHAAADPENVTNDESYFSSIERGMHAEPDTGLTVTLSTSQGSFMQVLDILRPPRPPASAADPVDFCIGMRSPMFGSCVGAAWLSCQDRQTVRNAIQLCRRELKSQKQHVGTMFERLGQIKEQGYAFGGLCIDDSVSSLAVPLPPCRDGIVLVIAVSGPSQQMRDRKDDIVALLQREISRCEQPKAVTPYDACTLPAGTWR